MYDVHFRILRCQVGATVYGAWRRPARHTFNSHRVTSCYDAWQLPSYAHGMMYLSAIGTFIEAGTNTDKSRTEKCLSRKLNKTATYQRNSKNDNYAWLRHRSRLLSLRHWACFEHHWALNQHHWHLWASLSIFGHCFCTSMHEYARVCTKYFCRKCRKMICHDFAEVSEMIKRILFSQGVNRVSWYWFST